VRGVDWGEFWGALKTTNYWLVLPALLALAVAVVLRALRWRLLFTPETRPPVREALDALLIGYLFNSILPARAGELARVLTLGSRSGVSRAQVVATVVLERAFDVLVLVALLVAAAPFLPPVDWLTAAVVLGAVAAAGLAVAAVLVRRHGVAAARVLLRPVGWLPGLGGERVEHMARSFVTGLLGITASRVTLVALAVTTVSWLVLACSIWLLLLGAGFDVSFGMALLTLVATNLVLVLPSSPGALGTFEAAVVVALGAYGVERSEALSFALVLHALNLFPYLAAGAIAVRFTRPAR
jgi:uncharacterized protein (TIRG00374 family)